MAGSTDTIVNGKSASFSGKIAVITNLPSQTQNDEEVWSAEQLIEKYGSDRIIHATWPAFFLREQEQVNAVIAPLSMDSEIKAIILNKTVPGCNAAIDRVKKIRDDIFFIHCVVTEPPVETAIRGNLILEKDDIGAGSAMVKQAKKQGAGTFVHYSFPRHISLAHRAKCRDLMRETCETEGIRFVDAAAVDPQEDMYGAQQFIVDDIPRLVAKYGEDTAFFATNCSLQIPLIKAVVDSHAIYPQPCCPSPVHGFPGALNFTPKNPLDSKYTINEARKVLTRKNETGRISTWPVSSATAFTNAGAEYAIMWINGEAPKTGINEKLLSDCVCTYAKEMSDLDIGCSFISYQNSGIIYENFKLMLMDYVTY